MSDGSKPRILLVDDALIIRGILNGLLKNDYDIVGDAGNGRDAIALVEELRPDIVLMDVTMPVMDGIEATRQITERCPGVEVVILSALTSESSIQAGLAAGARDYLAKPPNPKEILMVLDRLVQQRADRKNQVQTEGGLPGRGIWSFLGAVGGDGRTTFMLALANELLTMGRKVVVLDGDALFGDVGFYLDIGGGEKPGYAEFLDPEESLDETKLKQCLKQHPSGLQVLANAPLGRPVFGAEPERFIAAAHLLARHYEYVLVDLPSGIPDALLPLLDDSRYIFPISRGLPERLKNFRNLITTLKACGFEPPRLCPLLTQTDRGTSEKFVQGFQLEVREYFPTDREAVAEATRVSQPVSRVAPRSAYTQRLRNFVGEVLKIPAATEATEKPKLSLMERLRLRR
jgi:CheY-like chemotaxis protein